MPDPAPLEPLPYHRALSAYLRDQERPVWDWHAKATHTAAEADAVRLELLKSTYRLTRDAHADLYQRTDAIAHRLGATLPVTLYQAQVQVATLNADVRLLPGEAHLVFHGPIAQTLTGVELDAVLAHELGHLALWSADAGDLAVTDRVVAFIAHQHATAPSHEESARRWHLATEVFADRAALVATGDLHGVIRALVRTTTGGAAIDAAAFLAQADEILAQGPATAEGDSHPEGFLRAWALATWQRDPTRGDAAIERQLFGPDRIDQLDLIGQRRCTRLTERLLMTALQPTWTRSAPALAHARRFFPDLDPAAATDAITPADLADASASLRDYIAALLLDLACADRDATEAFLAHALQLAKPIGCDDRLADLAQKELKLKARDLARLRADAPAITAAAAAQHGRAR